MKKTKPPTKVRMGVDFGTTRTVVARVEGGNYPLVTFESEWGHGQEWYPSLIAGKGSQRVFGWEAWSQQSEEGMDPATLSCRDPNSLGDDPANQALFQPAISEAALAV